MTNVQIATGKKLWADLAFQHSARTLNVSDMQIVLCAYGLPHDREDAWAMVAAARLQIAADGGTL